MTFRRPVKKLVFFLAALLFSGCAAVPVAFLPAALPAIIAGAGSGVTYTFTNVAYRTLTYPVQEVEDATTEALDRMSIEITRVRHRKHYIKFTAKARKMTVYIDLERMTPTLTRMRVNAKRGLIFKDKTTAFEIIYQTQFALADERALERPGAGQEPFTPPDGQAYR